MVYPDSNPFYDLYGGSEKLTHLALRAAAGEAITARDIVIQYQVSRRTAYRYLSRLSNIMPIYNDRRGVWRVLDHAR